MKKKCILIVEDNRMDLNVFERWFRDTHNVLTAATGNEALKDTMGPDSGIDLVFSDVNLGPGDDGIEVMQQVRAHNPSLPYIITSWGDYEAKALAAGANRFIPRPYDLEKVEEVISELLGE